MLKCRYRYVDDTFIIWPHGSGFPGSHQWDTSRYPVYNRSGTLGHRVYRKPTHTDRYLNAESHNHPVQKQGITYTLIHRARIISEPRLLAEELEHLRTALRENSYTVRNIERAIRRRHTPMEKQEYLATTYLPYVKDCTNKIGPLLKKRNINTVFSTVKKVAAAFPKTCNNDQLQGLDVYSIPCSCGKVYIEQTGRHINMRLKKHKSHLKNNNWEKSAVQEHKADTGHTGNE
ncbi:uncharacterized protein LOC108912768 [Anoplophora glabripennis]|uniref:uncharacterized protein LOC108912768 n=1 Tax=Anoplophora glabripennis TaxID=217634 RepID=UPI00087599BD|nr:uncharacterized protein LOC108912768 [Anoplophora glabripennis]